MYIEKVVLPVAGSGTRLLPITKEQPKEMLPVFSTNTNGEKRVIPIIQLIFEQLFSENYRDFCFIVGRNKRIIEDHFTSDDIMTNSLYSQKKDQYVKELMIFFKKINQSQIVWINQSKPLGFGHAVLQSKSYVGNNRFLLHAGDTILLSKNNNHLKKLIQCHRKNKSVASFIVQKIKDPRHYGVIDGKTSGNIIKVTNLEEKPLRPKTNLAILPLYIFEPIIFQYIKNLKPAKHGEIQLTDAIINMVKDGLNVYAVDLTKEILHMDIGNPQSYWDSLNMSYKNIKQN